MHALGFPLLVGELGFRPDDQPTSGVSYHGEGGGQPPCGSTTLLAAETVYRVAPQTRLGVIVWHGFDLTTDGPQAWDLTGIAAHEPHPLRPAAVGLRAAARRSLSDPAGR